MGTFRAIATISLLASILASAACGGGSDAKPDAPVIIIPDAAIDAPPDAFEPQFDLSCRNNAAPTTADTNIVISGAALEVVIAGTMPSVAPSHNATIDTCKNNCAGGDKLDTKTTAASGCPSTGCPFTTGSLATNSQPFDIYLKVTKTNNRPTLLYPPAPLTTGFANVPAITFTNSAISALALAGINQEAGKGNLVLAIADCMNMPITNTNDIVLQIKQGGVAVAGTTEINASMFSPMLAGSYLVFNVPPGVTSIGATYKGMALRAHDVNVVAATTTATAVRPGY